MQKKPIEVFTDLQVGIMNLITAADLFTIHLLAKHRNADPPQDIIQIILGGGRLSSFTFSSDSYRPNEIEMLGDKGHVRQPGEQIVLATYTALENYLIQKFHEYYRHLFRSVAPDLVSKTLDRFSFRSLDNIKEHYFNVLDIHLPSFDFQYFTDEKSLFQPRDSWTAIKLLSQARNEIAHSGKSTIYPIATPMDSWYPFEFARGWVTHFDANFDPFVYEGRQTSLIQEYKVRLQQLAKK